MDTSTTEMSEERIAELLRERKASLFQELTKLQDQTKSRALSAFSAKAILRSADVVESELRRVQEKIYAHNFCCNEVKNKVKLTDIDSFNTVQLAISDACFEAMNEPSQAGSSSRADVPASRPSYLPKIEIEPFEGNISKYSTFIALFDQLIHKSTVLSPIEKLTYLRTLTKKEANALVSGFEFTGANYEGAYKALVERYSNSRRQGNYFFQQMLNSNSQKNVIEFLEVNRTAVNSMNALEVTSLSDYIMFEIIQHNCSPAWRKSFEMDFSGNTFPTTTQLFAHLQKIARLEEMKTDCDAKSTKTKPVIKSHAFVTSSNSDSNANSNNSNHSSNSSFKKTYSNQKSVPVPQTSSNSKTKCFQCAGSHLIYACAEFSKLPAADKQASVLQHNHCVNCLAKHLVQECSSTNRCRECQGQHHTYLHLAFNEPKVEAGTSTSLACSNSKMVLLGTVVVQIRDAFGNFHEARGILDPASEVNFISYDLAQLLGLKRSYDSVQPSGIGETQTKTLGKTNVNLRSRVDPAVNYNCSASVLSSICSELPSQSFSSDLAAKFSHLPLADPTFYEKGEIHLLLGVQAYTDLLSSETPNILHGKPTACKTKLGWILLGSAPVSKPEEERKVSLLVQNPSLDSILTRFFEIEDVKSHPCSLSPEENLCLNLFESSKSRDEDGRYSVPLLLNPVTNPELCNRSAAISSYKSLEKRIKRDDSLFQAYHKFMLEYQTEKHMRPLRPDEEQSPYLLPQHCVKKETSSTTKVRVVFNGSHKGQFGTCLNDFLMGGPKVQPPLIQVLLNFRIPEVALVTDVKMLYRQIKINPPDQAFLHTLWRPSPEVPLQEMVHERVVYGLKSSSFLAQACLRDLALQEKDEFPLAAAAIKNSTVMDDICSGATSVQQALELRSQLTSLLALGCFPLRKWVSSHPDVLKGLPEADLETPLTFDSGDAVFKILGLRWLPSNDSFSFNVQPFEGTATKRSILGYLARIFDPLGFLGPSVFFAKKIIQQSWLLELSWDEPLSTVLQNQWREFTTNIADLTNLRIPRCLHSSDATVSLVGFADGSNSGYAACLYAVVQKEDDIKSYLLTSKSRLAPLKNIQSIPRIELLAAHLLAELLAYVIQAIPSFANEQIYLFSDSQIVLAWLKTPPHTLQTFVANRVVGIQNFLTALPVEWRHIPTNLNAADCCSRGVPPQLLSQHPLWWAGPSFLTTPVTDWPVSPYSKPSELPELKSSTCLAAVIAKEPDKVMKKLRDLMLSISTLNRLQRVFGWLVRHDHNFFNPSKKIKGPLTIHELDKAMLLLVRVDQDAHGLTPGLKQLRKLTPFYDKHQILRVGGRLSKSSLAEEAKHPIILAKNSHLSALICDFYHRILIHSGPRTTQSFIQRRYWIMSAHSLIRTRIHACVNCLRFQAKPRTPFMAELPPQRVQPSFAFKCVSTDFAGPFLTKEYLTRRNVKHKSYFVCFVCHYSKAVHIEAVSELTTQAFIAALTRFVSRRGLCSDIHSDQGRNYVGSDRYLRECVDFLRENQDTLITAASTMSIQWHFTPPKAPNFNGLAEAVVKSAKLLLYRQLKDRCLTFEAFGTILARVEAVLNSRPLGFCSSDPRDDPDVLTPGHLLIGRALTALPEPVYCDDVSLRSQWDVVQQISQTFWRRWIDEYVHTQLQRQRWTKATESLKVGDVVFIYDKDASPLTYPIGRVLSVAPSKDGVVRVCSVRTSEGTYTRPVNRLLVLPSV